MLSQFKLFNELVGGRSRNQSPTNCKPNGDFSAIVINDDYGEVQSGCCDETISKYLQVFSDTINEKNFDIQFSEAT